jgi:serine phosphatase RsbU (regulator of sigma subunit)/anti-sigma regulatory factor (Ser/Thr protein kinase)
MTCEEITTVPAQARSGLAAATTLSEPHVRGVPWVPQTHRDHAMASVLRRLYQRLHASTYAVYLPTEDGSGLAVAMALNTTLSFTITPGMAADDLRYSAARAHHTGTVVVLDEREIRALTRSSPAALLHNSYHMLIASVPVRTLHHRYGVLTVRWEHLRPLDQKATDCLQQIADELALELEDLADHGEAMAAPPLPLFIPPFADADLLPGVELYPGAEPCLAGAPEEAWDAGESMDTAVVANTFLYQLQRLSTILTGTECVRDVVTATYDHVARPMGAGAVMLCLTQAGHLHVAGSVGFSREAVQRIEGTPLRQCAPETDTVAGVECRHFGTLQELRAAYPEIDHDPEYRARAYAPLISRGQAVGCCVLGFPEPDRPPLSAETAILTLMMEQVGQALERANAYQTQHALTRTMQHSLLPRRLPQLPEAVTTARYFPATHGAEVGGDWYDVVQLPGGGIALVIGDVEGHSLDAVEVMGQLRSGVRAYAAEGHEPASVLQRSNRLLLDLDTDLYATCCYLSLDPATGIVDVATAGHHAPLLSDAHGLVTPIPVAVGPPLGVEESPAYQQDQVCLEPGSVAALFTDGLLAHRRLETDATIARLSGLLADHRHDNLEKLADRLVSQCHSEAMRDDAALLLMRYEGAQPGHCPRVARTSVPRHDLQGVARVRHFLDDLLRRWDLASLFDDLELLASEVVTNALIHAHSEVDLRVRAYPDRIRIEVHDCDPHPPVPTAILSSDPANNKEAESGRGLLIVEALASDWGSSPAGRGKTTWCEIPLAAARGGR